MAPLRQLLFLSSPLGDDTVPNQGGTLHATKMIAEEQLSRPFEVQLEVVSTNQAVEPNQLLHKPVTITVHLNDAPDRYISGLVRRFENLEVAQRDRWYYRLEVVPALWFLSQAVDCRIFQHLTTVEILERLFSEQGVEPVDFRIFGPQQEREYTTQFNETDLDFVHRLLQEAGYFYFFEHRSSGTTLVIADRNEAFQPMQRPLHRVNVYGTNTDVLDGWETSERTTYGRVRLQDYDPEKPAYPVTGDDTTVLGAAGAPKRDVFRWPAMTTSNEIAGDRARFRMQAGEASASLCRGSGHNPLFAPGLCFELECDPSSFAENVPYVVHGTRQVAVDTLWFANDGPSSWRTEFSCFPRSTPWRDELSMPRPAMSGIYSGIVLGEGGEEIHADRLGRIKVRPLFDHREDTVASMAIWVRILNAWSGHRWGWQHLPRVGTEVGLSFMNGDPDNPVVVGCFYNADMMPVFEIPAEQTIQGFRSRSTLKGNEQQYSQLSFDDRIEREMVLLHAQKDYRVEVENNKTVTARNVLIEAAESITLVVGGTTLKLTKDVMTLDSSGLILLNAVGDVNVDAVGAVTIEAGGEVNIAGTSVDIEAVDGAVVCLPLPI